MHIRPVQQNDLYDFARVAGISMWNDEIMQYTAPYKDKYPDSYFAYCLHRTKIRYYRGELLFLAVSDAEDADWAGEGVILGYCCYSTTVKGAQKQIRGGWLGNRFERLALDCWSSYTKMFAINRSSDPVAEQHFRASLAEANFLGPYLAGLPSDKRQRIGDQHWELELLGTHPDFRRRGVGKTMLQWGFERAREDAVPLILIASIAGEKLYLTTGFKEVSRIRMLPGGTDALKDIDMGQGKGNGLSWAGMVWEPEAMRRGAYANHA